MDKEKSKAEVSFENIDAIEDDWLKEIYKHYQARFLSDNNRIWTTAAIFIPLSLAPFVVLIRENEFTLIQLIVIATISSLFLVAWLAIAESHKQYQEKSMLILRAIERKKGLMVQNNRTRRLGAKHSRWLLASGIWLSWLAIFFFWPMEL